MHYFHLENKIGGGFTFEINMYNGHFELIGKWVSMPPCVEKMTRRAICFLCFEEDVRFYHGQNSIGIRCDQTLLTDVGKFSQKNFHGSSTCAMNEPFTLIYSHFWIRASFILFLWKIVGWTVFRRGINIFKIWQPRRLWLACEMPNNERWEAL